MSEKDNHLNDLLKDPEFKEVWDLAAQYQFPEAKGNDESWKKFQQRVENNKPKLKVSYSRIMAYAAAIGLFILSSVVIYNFNSYNESHPLAEQNIVTAGGELKKISLADGTVITMNGHSKLSYELNEKSRIIHLTGMAHFEVAPNKEAPFSVITEKGTVTVLGTGFDVSSYTNKNFQVVVNHGKVRVQNQNKNQETILTKGMMAISVDGKKLETSDNYISHSEWMGQFLVFHDASLDEVFTVLEEKFGVEITTNNSNQDINSKKFTGKFKQNQSLDSICKVLDEALNIKISTKK